MPRLEYFLIAESVSVDQHTNRVSLFHVLDLVELPSFPDIVPQLVVVSVWDTPHDERQSPVALDLWIHPPSGPPIKYDMTLEASDSPRRRAFMILQYFEFTLPGDWRFEIKLNDQHKAEHVIHARKQD